MVARSTLRCNRGVGGGVYLKISRVGFGLSSRYRKFIPRFSMWSFCVIADATATVGLKPKGHSEGYRYYEAFHRSPVYFTSVCWNCNGRVGVASPHSVVAR